MFFPEALEKNLSSPFPLARGCCLHFLAPGPFPICNPTARHLQISLWLSCDWIRPSGSSRSISQSQYPQFNHICKMSIGLEGKLHRSQVWGCGCLGAAILPATMLLALRSHLSLSVTFSTTPGWPLLPVFLSLTNTSCSLPCFIFLFFARRQSNILTLIYFIYYLSPPLECKAHQCRILGVSFT